MAEKNYALVTGSSPVTMVVRNTVASNRPSSSRPAVARQFPVVGVLALSVLGLLQSACATDHLSGGTKAEGGYRASPPTASTHLISEETHLIQGEAEGSTTGGERSGIRSRRPARRDGEADRLEGWAEKEMGWPDGVGNGLPSAVPMSLDYFQGFLLQAGIPSSALPVDGRTLSPEQALGLLPHLLSTPVTLGNFGPRRMAAHLLLEVATGATALSRDELHARMRRFSQLRVARPDGYLVKPTTGEAVQKVGEGILAEDGTLRAGRIEVGPFYAIEGGHLFPVDGTLEVPRGAQSVGPYEPDDGVVSPLAEGAMLAVVDTLEGLYRLVFHTGETLEGLAQLPGAVRELYANAPHLWEELRHKPYAERVRTISRIATGMLLMVGTSGAGAAKAASWGGKLGNLAIPLFSLSGDGLLAMRLVAVPVGGAIAVSGQALSATYVLHMANVGIQGAGNGGGWPPVGGPGRWIEDTSNMSKQASAYQAQVTGAPKGWCYKVCRNGECVEYDGYDPKTNTLLEAKGIGYDKWFNPNLEPRFEFKGLEGLRTQARMQSRLAGGLRVRWDVAEPRMVAILQKLFSDAKIRGIEVVYTPSLP